MPTPIRLKAAAGGSGGSWYLPLSPGLIGELVQRGWQAAAHRNPGGPRHAGAECYYSSRGSIL
ncbi:MAG TPA: hypothetical protein VFR55_15020 [Dehalococcoidia bacterium]|nr:hypothetical protein [Dehalococcoidia bacterium]